MELIIIKMDLALNNLKRLIYAIKPPSSPDLTPCNFFFSPSSRETNFNGMEVIYMVVMTELKSIP